MVVRLQGSRVQSCLSPVFPASNLGCTVQTGQVVGQDLVQEARLRDFGGACATSGDRGIQDQRLPFKFFYCLVIYPGTTNW